jgi:intracellular sulfur oxidation DsrE/DsrF family protein
MNRGEIMQRWICWIMPCLALSVMPAALATTAANGQWVFPVIKNFGGVHPPPYAAVQPDAEATYQAFFYVTCASSSPSKVNPGLEHLARAVNVMAASGVPLSQLHYVALIHVKAAFSVLRDPYYHLLKGTDNPNLVLLHELHKAGVRLLVCGQALAAMKVRQSWIDPDGEVSLSALSDEIIYGDKGYAFVDL